MLTAARLASVVQHGRAAEPAVGKVAERAGRVGHRVRDGRCANAEPVRELQELRRQASSSIVLPQGGGQSMGAGFPPGGLGGGKIKLP